MARQKLRAELDDLAEAVLGVRGLDEGEIVLPRHLGDLGDDRRQGGVAFVDRVGRPHDEALAFLAVNEGEAGDGGAFRANQVLQHVAGADTGQLVGVTNQEEMGADRHGLQERGGEAGVEHRDLIDDQKIGGEGVRLVHGEAARGALVFEQAVDGRGLSAGRLGEALRGAAGRRGEMNAAPSWP